ncbi:hypothetical protein F2P81_024937 [Scophthalmus maximus]|uniref:Uncharacterized protein n=1 Tax=Scophthalmus maximus TaxID=52904 RepID=A0A6A4RKD7_SCOMX|nr:hypothetical protein F2P81_024937 [Scophthalmus maximus]
MESSVHVHFIKKTLTCCFLPIRLLPADNMFTRCSDKLAVTRVGTNRHGNDVVTPKPCVIEITFEDT